MGNANELQRQLEALTSNPQEQLAYLEALEAKRRERNFIAYWQPHVNQREGIGKFAPNIKTFGILGGNRAGKTEAGAALVVAAALGKEYFRDEPAWSWVQHLPFPDPPLNIWVVALDFQVLRDIIWSEKFLQGRNHPALVPADTLAKQPSLGGDLQLRFKNGSVITGKSAESGREKFQSASVDLAWIDEEPEVEIFDEIYQRTIDCAGKILVTLTPLTDIASGVRVPWVHDLYEAAATGRAKDVRFVQLSVMDNPSVPQEEKTKLLEKWAGHPEEKARLYGDFVQRSGLVYNMYDPKRHLEKPFVIPRDWRRIVSIDPANTGTTAALWGAVDPQNNLHLYREYYERDLVISQHAKNILMRNGGEPIDLWIIDPKWGSQREGQTHKTGAQLYVEAGIPVRLATPGEDYGMAASREYMNATVTPASRYPKVKIFDDLHNLKYEITHYVWASFGRGDLKGLSKEKPLKRFDHLCNAMQYLMALRPRFNRTASPYPDTEDGKRQYAQLNSY